jgi:SAM-dependent methyltransferase
MLKPANGRWGICLTKPSSSEDRGGWARAYRNAAESGSALAFPNETLVRLLKGAYIPDMPRSFSGMRALDVSTGSGNNIYLLASLGFDVYGTEIAESICMQTTAELARSGIKVELRVGNNTRLPFENDFFDFLISWNVLHYEDNEAAVVAGIREYARVLKPGGRLLLSTTGPDHKILTNATTLGGHRYCIGRQDDFRKGSIYFYFDAENYLQHYFGMAFGDVMTGRTHDRLFTETLDWFIVTGKARRTQSYEG